MQPTDILARYLPHVLVKFTGHSHFIQVDPYITSDAIVFLAGILRTKGRELFRGKGYAMKTNANYWTFALVSYVITYNISC